MKPKKINKVDFGLLTHEQRMKLFSRLRGLVAVQNRFKSAQEEAKGYLEEVQIFKKQFRRKQEPRIKARCALDYEDALFDYEDTLDNLRYFRDRICQMKREIGKMYYDFLMQNGKMNTTRLAAYRSMKASLRESKNEEGQAVSVQGPLLLGPPR